MADISLIRSFLQQATAQGSRSTVLKPIGWMMSICIGATLSSAYMKSPPWLTYMFAAFSSITMLLYLGAYVFCLAKDRDALRSETYTIQKLAIEKGFIGDSLSGVISSASSASGNRIADASADSAVEGDK